MSALRQTGSTFSSNSKTPFSFKTALDQIEDEVLMLAAEVNYCKKEVMIQKSECQTIAEVADSQCKDIERYLKKEVGILDDCISKQRTRQNAEYSRLNKQCADVTDIKAELENRRLNCVKRIHGVQEALGIETDPNEHFMQPMTAEHVRSSKIAIQ